MTKKVYEVPQLIDYGGLEQLTQGLPQFSMQQSIIVSDHAAKENFTIVNPQDVLARLAKVPIETWNYKAQNRSVRHIGPMAQDFSAAFGVGEDDKHINLIDANGVTMAAIQALYQLVQEKDSQISTLQAEVEQLKRKLDQ
jgi:hypothetical protein